MEIRLKAYPQQAALLESRARFKGFVGGRGSGKSEAGAMDILLRSLRPEGRNRLYMIGAPTYQGLHDFTIRSFRKVLESAGLWRDEWFRSTYNNPAYMAPWAEFIFRSADNPERFRGPNLGGLWLDEASLYETLAWDNAIACVRDGDYVGDVTATFTPQGKTHWTYATFASGKPNTFLVRASSRDNPFLSPDFYANLIGQYGAGSRTARQELEGEFLSPDGAEWPPEYFDDIRFTDWPRVNWAAKAMALDPSKGREVHARKEGRQPDYSAWVWGGVDAKGNVFIDADLDNSRDVTRIVADGIGIYQRFQPHAVVCETNGFQELIGGEFFRQAKELRIDLPLYGIENYTVKKETRIRTLGPYLARREIRIRKSRGGEMLLGQLTDFPEAEHDDGPDCLDMLMRTLRWLISGGGNADANAPRILRP